MTLPPGKRFCPYHSHTAEHELYVVVSGRGEMRHPGGLEPMGPGDSFHFPPGEAHQVINSGTDPLVYYVIANNVLSDDCYYPDSDKVGALLDYSTRGVPWRGGVGTVHRGATDSNGDE